VPIYTYTCTSCNDVVELRQSFTDPPLTTCEQCGGTLRKIIHPVGIVFKGSGWYSTDSRASSASGGSSAADSAGAKDSSAKDSSSKDGSGTKDAASKDGAASKESGAKDSGSKDASAVKDSGASRDSGTKASTAASTRPASNGTDTS